MRNYPVIEKIAPMLKGIEEATKNIWVSRSIAVVAFVFCRDKDGVMHILVSKRGEGTPDLEYWHTWNCQCGYLDYDETTREAASRETYEETGIRIPPAQFGFWSFNDDPADSKRQNVTFRYYTIIHNKTIEDFEFSRAHMEKDEVEEIRWMRLDEIDEHKWAFGHDKLIPRLAEELNLCQEK